MTDAPDSRASQSQVGPAVARELVRLRLKELREKSELSHATVAADTGYSVSKLSRVEKGEVTIQPFELKALLAYYGVVDENEQADLARLSQASRSQQWYAKHRLAGDFRKFVSLEFEADVIKTWQLLFVPGLLQTEEYAHAITALSMRRSPDDREVRVRTALRMDRQREFQRRLQGPRPPRIVAVIDESVLRRPVGGRDTLRRQLDHLLNLSEDRESYTFAVTPLDLAHHSGLGGIFELLQFKPPMTGPATPGSLKQADVLFVESAAGGDQLIDDKEQTELFGQIVDDLLTYGRTGDDAIDFIRSCRDSLSQP